MKLFLDDQFGDMAEMKKLHSALTRDKEQLEREIARLQQGLITKEDAQNREEALKSLFSKIGERLEHATYEDKKGILHLFVDRITLFAKQNYAEVVFKFPTSTVMSSLKIESPSQESIPLFLNIKTLPYQEARIRVRKETRNLIKTAGTEAF